MTTGEMGGQSAAAPTIQLGFETHFLDTNGGKPFPRRWTTAAIRRVSAPP